MKSERLFAILSCTLCTILIAFFLSGEPFEVLDNLRWTLASSFSSLRKKRGLDMEVPSEIVAKSDNPTLDRLYNKSQI